MPVFKSSELLAQLKGDAAHILQHAEKLQQTDSDILSRQPAQGNWSIAQVLAHLNFYSSYYNGKLESALAKTTARSGNFKSGWLGNHFAKMMLPKQDGTVANTMSAPKDSRPAPVLDAAAVVKEFIAFQQQLIMLLENASAQDLGVRIPTTMSSIIRLRAGDTFRFLIAHQQRHFAQVARAAKAIGYKEVQPVMA